MYKYNPLEGYVARARSIGVKKGESLDLKEGLWYTFRNITQAEFNFLKAERQKVENPNSKPLLEFFFSDEARMEVIEREREEALQLATRHIPGSVLANPPATPQFKFDPARMGVAGTLSEQHSASLAQNAQVVAPVPQPVSQPSPVASTAPVDAQTQSHLDYLEAMQSADVIDAQGITPIKDIKMVANPTQSGNLIIK
jgi:hypothetical protein